MIVGIFIDVIEKPYGKTNDKSFLLIQLGDVQNIFADTGKLEMDISYYSVRIIEKGAVELVKWSTSDESSVQ